MGIVRYILSWLWYSAESAKAGGMTHHGRIYGCPAWVFRAGGVFIVETKVPALAVYTSFCDMAFDALGLAAPIHVGKPI